MRRFLDNDTAPSGDNLQSTEKLVPASGRLVDGKHVTEHLANDRTFLAWIRTGVSMLGLGIVIAKLRYMLGAAYPETTGAMHAVHIGLWFAAIGVVIVILAAVVYMQTRNQIRLGTYYSNSVIFLALTTLISVLGVLVLWYLMQPVSPPAVLH